MFNLRRLWPHQAELIEGAVVLRDSAGNELGSSASPMEVQAVSGERMSEVIETAVPNGEFATPVVDLGATYKIIRVIFPDNSGIGVGNTLRCGMAPTANEDFLVQVCPENDPSQVWAVEFVNGTASLVITHAFGARLFWLWFEVAVTEEVPVAIVGYGRYD